VPKNLLALPLWKPEYLAEAHQRVSGLPDSQGTTCHAHLVKVQILGVAEIQDKKVFCASLLFSEESHWVAKTFFANMDPGNHLVDH